MISSTRYTITSTLGISRATHIVGTGTGQPAMLLSYENERHYVTTKKHNGMLDFTRSNKLGSRYAPYC